jgi:two-component system, NtrC family, sensor histidine kinase PilS
MRRSAALPEPGRVLSWVYVGRICLTAALVLAAVLTWRTAPAGITVPALLLFAATVAFTAVSGAYTHVARRLPGRSFLYWQVVYDVTLVTAVVYLTGGRDSDFAPLYVLVIVTAAILLPFIGGVLIGLLISIVYLAQVVWSTAEFDGSAGLQAALFAAVALVTGYLGDRLRRTGMVLGEVETELHRLRLDTDDVLNSIATGILTVDAGGRLAYLNPAAEEMLGLPSRDWLGRPVLPRLDEIAAGLGGVIRRSLQARAPVRRFETRGPDGGRVLGVSTTLIQRDPEQPPSVTAIFQDITERKRIDQLHRRAERLEALAELSASLAHEIKNPLASIRSATEQLSGERIDAEDRGVLRELVVRESERLSRLLTEFIDFSRVNVRASERVEAGPLVRGAVDLVRAHPEAAGVEIRWRCSDDAGEVAVQGDEDLLHRAVLNLVLNAAQWSGIDGRVQVEVDAVRTDILTPDLGPHRAVRIRVADSGPGVAPEDAERVFDPFFTLRPGGTGLGLATVHRTAEAHGGAVLVETARGADGGATFALYLPAAAAEAGAAIPQEARL